MNLSTAKSQQRFILLDFWSMHSRSETCSSVVHTSGLLIDTFYVWDFAVEWFVVLDFQSIHYISGICSERFILRNFLIGIFTASPKYIMYRLEVQQYEPLNCKFQIYNVSIGSPEVWTSQLQNPRYRMCRLEVQKYELLNSRFRMYRLKNSEVWTAHCRSQIYNVRIAVERFILLDFWSMHSRSENCSSAVHTSGLLIDAF
jgi:hypothetical protein